MKSDKKQIDSVMAILPKRGDLRNPKCPTREVIDSITGLWGILILKALNENKVLRNAELRKLVPGISEKMLAQTLRRLERIGFVTRESYPEVPPKVEYRLSKIGRQSSKVITGLCELVEGNMRIIARQMLEYDHSDHSRPWQKPRR